MSGFGAARRVLEEAIETKVAPAAVAEIGTSGGEPWRAAEGRLTFDGNAPAASLDTVFDLASLTKVLATTTLVLEAAADGTLGLDDPVARWLPAWNEADRKFVTTRHLLLHSSGLPAWLPLFQQHSGPEAFERAICATPLEYEPGSRSVYSDLGFILLGFVLERARGKPLSSQASALFSRLGAPGLGYLPPGSLRQRTAPARSDSSRGPLQGVVDDDNAWALGGVSGHAGLFGTVKEVGVVARAWLCAATGRPGSGLAASRALVEEFVTRGNVPGSSRALGWDTMTPEASCGNRMSARAYGHTGWTGTSLWIDPARDFYAVLLTNRVHPTAGDDAGIRRLRRAFHDAIDLNSDGVISTPSR